MIHYITIENAAGTMPAARFRKHFYGIGNISLPPLWLMTGGGENATF